MMNNRFNMLKNRALSVIRYYFKLFNKHRDCGYVEQVSLTTMQGWSTVSEELTHQGVIHYQSENYIVNLERYPRLDVTEHRKEFNIKHGFRVDLPARLRTALIREKGVLQDLELSINGKLLPFYDRARIQNISDYQQHRYQSIPQQKLHTITTQDKGQIVIDGIRQCVIHGRCINTTIDVHEWMFKVDSEVIDITVLSDTVLSDTPLSNSRQENSSLESKNISHFEIEIPGLFWNGKQQARCLSLHYRKTPVIEGVVINGLFLNDWLHDIACFHADSDYLNLLALEHLHHYASTGNLEPRLLAHFQQIAGQYHLTDYIQNSAYSSASPDLPLEISQTETQDKAAQAAINMEKAKKHFSAYIAEQKDIESTLAFVDATLQKFISSEEDKALFIATITPWFCRTEQFSDLFAHYKSYLSEIYLLSANHGVWMKSLLVCWALQEQNLSLSDSLWQEINHSPEGWLNTECFAQALNILMSEQYAISLQQRQDFVTHFLTTIEGLSEQFWSRIYDIYLMQSFQICLSQYHKLTSEQQQKSIQLTASVFGLCPDFWRLLQDSSACIPEEIRRIQHHAIAVFNMADNAAPGGLKALEYFLATGNTDAKTLHRHLIVNSRDRKLFSGKKFQPETSSDLIRLAAFPCEIAPLDKSQLRQLPQLIKDYSAEKQSADTRWQQLCNGAVTPHEILDEITKIQSMSFIPDEHALAFYGLSLLIDKIPADRLLRHIEQLVLQCLSSDSSQAVIHPHGQVRPILQSTLARIEEHIQGHTQEDKNAAQKQYSNILKHLTDHNIEYIPNNHSEGFSSLSKSQHSDVLVVVYSCQKYLDARLPVIRQSWVADLKKRGIPYVVLTGNSDKFHDSHNVLNGDVLTLDVADNYENLPKKSLALYNWVLQHTNFQYVLKVDDDCYLNVDAFFDSLSFRKFDYYGRIITRDKGSMDRLWHQDKSTTEKAKHSLDKSPEPSTYCDGGAGYCLSRFSLKHLAKQQNTYEGKQLIATSYMEDKLIGDLLHMAGITPSNEDYQVLIRRTTHAGAVPVNMWDNNFYPGYNSPTKLVHTDNPADIPEVAKFLNKETLHPKKLWPSHQEISLGYNSNQLELICDISRLSLLSDCDLVVIAVFYNEKLLLPHFLAHYRNMGVKTFILVDNLSNDGTREYLLEQQDVILYSADTEYKHSHYGVEWQQSILTHHCIGKWVIVADADEFLIYPDMESLDISQFIASVDDEGADSLFTAMVDMYPYGDLADADFSKNKPLDVAPYYDNFPLSRDHIGSGHFSAHKSYVSSLKHRQAPSAKVSDFVSQKIAVIKYQPWMRFSEGLHYCVNNRLSESKVAFCHFKYHAEFKNKILREIQRQQHYNNAREYFMYMELLQESHGQFGHKKLSKKFSHSTQFLTDLYKEQSQ